jgi:hypothetical protein
MLLLIGAFGSVILIISYSLLGGWIAVMSEVIVLPRNFAMYLIDKKKTNADRKTMSRGDWIIAAVTIAVVFVSGVFTWDGFLCLFIIVGSVFYNYSVCQKNIGLYCLLGLFGVSCYIIYDTFAVKSVVGLAFDTILFISGVIGTVRYYKKRKVPALAKIHLR